MVFATRSLLLPAAIFAISTLLAVGGCRSAAPAASAPADSAPTASAPVAELTEPLPEASASPAATAPVAPGVSYKNTIRWTTASEVDSFGFDVFRGELEEGPFERLNAKPIAGAGTSDESHSYAFVDDTIDPTKEYFYYVESISIDGVRERFTPVNRAAAKIAPAAASPDPAVPGLVQPPGAPAP